MGLACLLGGGWGHAAGIAVGPGASAALGGGMVNLGCGNLEVAGNLDMGAGSIGSAANVTIQGVLQGGSGSIALGGDWVNSGAFIAGDSQVTLGDDCSDGTSTVAGDTTFHDLSVLSQSGHQVSWEQGSTTGVLGSLVLRGAAGKLLGLMSAVPGQPWFLILAAGGSQDVAYVSVSDSHASLPGQYMAPGLPDAFDSRDDGNNFRWFLDSHSFPVPVLNVWGLVLLAALILTSVLSRARRGREQGN